MFCLTPQVVSIVLNLPTKTDKYAMSKISVSADWFRAVCLFVAIALAGLAADLLTKYWVYQALEMSEPGYVYWVWQDVVGFQTSLNTGALFGFGAGQTIILVILSLVFLAGIILYVVLWAWHSLFLSAILGMITAGICGNLYDRLGLHCLKWNYADNLHEIGDPVYAVRDWILVMIGRWPWPNFNIADSLLVCGTILLAIYIAKEPGTTDVSSAENSDAGETPAIH